MLSTRLIDELRYERELVDVVKYLPEPVDVKDIGTRFGIMRGVSMHMLDRYPEQMIQQTWLDIYYVLLKKLAEVFIGREEYFIIRMIPYVQPFTGEFEQKIGCFVECMVAPTKSIVIPQFTYSNYNGHMVVEEWRCGHCATPNVISKRLCTQCGAPRLELIQELFTNLRNGVDVCDL